MLARALGSAEHGLILFNVSRVVLLVAHLSDPVGLGSHQSVTSTS